MSEISFLPSSLGNQKGILKAYLTTHLSLVNCVAQGIIVASEIRKKRRNAWLEEGCLLQQQELSSVPWLGTAWKVTGKCLVWSELNYQCTFSQKKKLSEALSTFSLSSVVTTHTTSFSSSPPSHNDSMVTCLVLWSAEFPSHVAAKIRPDSNVCPALLHPGDSESSTFVRLFQ